MRRKSMVKTDKYRQKERYHRLSIFMWVVAAILATVPVVEYISGCANDVVSAYVGLVMPFISFAYLFQYKAKLYKKKHTLPFSHYIAYLLMVTFYIMSFGSAICGILYAHTGIYPNDPTQMHLITLLCSANALVFGMAEENLK